MFKKKDRYYYIGYLTDHKDCVKYGSGTFKSKGLPDLETYEKEIKAKFSCFSVVILSCIEVAEDFI